MAAHLVYAFGKTGNIYRHHPAGAGVLAQINPMGSLARFAQAHRDHRDFFLFRQDRQDFQDVFYLTGVKKQRICVYLRLIVFLSLRVLAPKTIRVYPVNPVKYKITIKPTQT